MKRIILLTFSFLFFTYIIAQTNNKKITGDLKKLEWVLGEWVLIKSKSGISGIEYWRKISSSEYSGLAITLNGRDTVSIEKIKIIKKGNNIFYVAEVKENQKPVYFKFTKVTGDEFVCENPRHDFPKKITYKTDGNNLMAAISGGKKNIEYHFQKN